MLGILFLQLPIFIFLQRPQKNHFGFRIKFPPRITEWFMLRIAMSFCHTGPKDHNATKQIDKFILLCAIGQYIKTCYCNMLKRLNSSPISQQIRFPISYLHVAQIKQEGKRTTASLSQFLLPAAGQMDIFCVPKRFRRVSGINHMKIWHGFPTAIKDILFYSLCAGLVRRN